MFLKYYNTASSPQGKGEGISNKSMVFYFFHISSKSEVPIAYQILLNVDPCDVLSMLFRIFLCAQSLYT